MTSQKIEQIRAKLGNKAGQAGAKVKSKVKGKIKEQRPEPYGFDLGARASKIER